MPDIVRLRNSFRLWLAFARHAWSDSRVPAVARTFVFLGLLYWLSPLDLKPDYLPWGYIDDLSIVPLLLIAAAVLVPAAVYDDARKAAVRSLCGLLCLSFVVSVEVAPGLRWESRTVISNSISIHSTPAATACSSSQIHPYAGGRQSGGEGNHPVAAKNRTCNLSMFACRALPEFDLMDANSRSTFAGPDENEPLRIVSSRRSDSQRRTSAVDVYLACRGGQHQLYASETDAAILLPTNTCNISMPSATSADGIFLSNQVSLLS